MIRNRALLRTAVLALAGLLALSACGTTEPPKQPDPAPAGAGGPVTVTDSRGKEIKLDAPAKRVVVLEWGEAEMLATLGVMPVGVADIEGYGTWTSAEPLAESVVDVGTRAEPSVDSIVKLNPDLVVVSGPRSASLAPKLEEYVPVLATAGGDTSDNLKSMRDDFTMIAKAVGKTERAEEVLNGFDAAVAETRRKLADAGAAGASFVLADGYKQGSTISIRTFGEGALLSQVAIAAGLKNAWPGEGDKVYGLDKTDVEGLTKIEGDDVRFLYNASGEQDVFANDLPGNPIWQALPFVQAGRVHRMSDGIWTFGGPKSCEQFLDELVRIYTA